MSTADIIYLDYAAATPMSRAVLEAMQPYQQELFYNPSSPYKQAVEVRRAYEAAKHRIAETIGAKPDELIMTAGATESINLAFRVASGDVITTAIEHPAVLEAAKRRSATIIDVEPNGRVSVEAIQAAITDRTTLISVGLANSELGTVQPLRDIARVVQSVREDRAAAGNSTPLLFHSDASQGVGQLDIHVARLGVDMITLNAAKIYGPKQVGLLWHHSSVHLTPEIVGGGQEQGLRSGTENVAGVIGFAEAIHEATKKRIGEQKRLADLRDGMQAQLLEAFPDAVVTGAKKHRLAGHLHISFPNIDAERLIFLLEAENVLVATGSACSANKGTASHVLRALGLDESLISGSVRITLGRYTTKEQCAAASNRIIAAVQSEYKRTGGAQ